MTVEHSGYILGLGHEFGHILDDHFALVVGVEHLCLHHATAHGGHLRTVFGVDDGCYDVSAKGRTNLVEQVVIVLAQLLVVVGTNLQCGAVGGQTAVQSRAHTWAKVASHHIGTHQAYLWLLLLEQVYQHGSVGLGGIGCQSRCIKDVQAIHSVGEDLLFHLSCDAASCGYGLQLHAQRVGQFAALGKQFLAHLSHLCAFYLAIYEYVVHVSYPPFYPMVWLARSSCTSELISSSLPVSTLLSLALNTMFSTFFTLVGEPARPHCCRSAFTSAQLSWPSFR